MKLRINVADRKIVTPGEELAIVEEEQIREFKHIPEKHIYIRNNRVYSDVLGIVSISDNDLSVIPLEGTYIPKKDDKVIGIVSSIGITNWIIDIRSPYKAILNGSDVIDNFTPIVHNLRDYLDVGDYILAKIAVFDRTRDPVLTIRGKGLGKITEGIVVSIKPSRVPRIIGKKGSMLNTLVELTKCEIDVAQNGLIWIKCKNDKIRNTLIKAIEIINEKPHIRGLTEEIKSFLIKELGEGESV